jgi:hypothetical protein
MTERKRGGRGDTDAEVWESSSSGFGSSFEDFTLYKLQCGVVRFGKLVGSDILNELRAGSRRGSIVDTGINSVSNSGPGFISDSEMSCQNDQVYCERGASCIDLVIILICRTPPCAF